jgi:hypothetical protein
MVPSARVTLINEGTGEQRTATTAETGSFVFPSLLPGQYTVKIECQGFQAYQKTGNALSATERLNLAIQMSVGSLTETIKVTAEGATVQTASSESSSLLTSNQLDTIAQRGRVVTNYLLLLPGVNTTNPQDAPGGFITVPSANGVRNQATTISIDGLQGQDLGTTSSFTLSVSPDAVQEIQVLSNNYQAEYGRNGGASVNVITRSGGREFHGTAYWYKRHEMFNANNFFNNRQSKPKGRYRYTTLGASIGGPIFIPNKFNQAKDKLFFFYNFETNPSTSTTVSNSTLPTDLERKGDFSQSLAPNGSLIVLRDPLTGNPFPSNKIPTAQLNTYGQQLMKIFPMPNVFDRAVTLGTYNFTNQYAVPNERINHLFRIDIRPTSKDTIFFRGGTSRFEQMDNLLSGWGWGLHQFGVLNKNASLGYTRIISPTIVNEFTAGVRRPQERTIIEDAGTKRTTYGITLGQFHPEQNWDNLVPQMNFSGAGLQNLPSLTDYQWGRFPQQETDILYYFANNLTVTKGKHILKFGFYWERDRMTTGSGAGTIPSGRFAFNVDTNNPGDARHPFANLVLGNFQSYSENSVRTRPAGVANSVDWFVQDSWKVSRRLTLDLGLRTVHSQPWYGWHGTATAWAIERFDPKKAPVLFRPVMVNGQRMAQNPLTGAVTYPALIGAFVPGTGDPGNGTLTSKDTSYPRGFQEYAAQLFEPRFGFAWDVFGNSKTAVRGGFSYQHQQWRYEPRGAMAPINFIPTVYNGNLDTLLNSAGYLAPSSVNALDKQWTTPGVYNISLGVQQDVGFGTVMDVKYVSTLGRHLQMQRAINTYNYGTRFLPQNQDPTTNKPLADAFLTPFQGWAGINYYEGSGSSNYHALQASANRRYARNLQYGVAYTYSKTMDYGATLPIYRPARVWNYALASFDQTHMFTVNYTYTVPKLSQHWQNPVVAVVFDHWELSGVTSFASGTPSGIGLSLSDGADLTGGGDGQRPNVIADPRISHGERGFLKMFNTAAFARPGMNDPGNAPLAFVRNPGINNWDLTVFKNFPLKSEKRSLQFRWEFYNFFNHTQFSTMNTTATFDALGRQVNTQFGQATAARTPRLMQVSLRLRF